MIRWQTSNSIRVTHFCENSSFPRYWQWKMLTLKIYAMVTEYNIGTVRWQITTSIKVICLSAVAATISEILTSQMFALKVTKYNICSYAIRGQMPTYIKVISRIFKLALTVSEKIRFLNLWSRKFRPRSRNTKLGGKYQYLYKSLLSIFRQRSRFSRY